MWALTGLGDVALVCNRGASGVLTELLWTQVSFSLRWVGGSSIGGSVGVVGTGTSPTPSRWQ